MNVALPPGTGDSGWLRAFHAVVPPLVRAFEPRDPDHPARLRHPSPRPAGPARTDRRRASAQLCRAAPAGARGHRRPLDRGRRWGLRDRAGRTPVVDPPARRDHRAPARSRHRDTGRAGWSSSSDAPDARDRSASPTAPNRPTTRGTPGRATPTTRWTARSPPPAARCSPITASTTSIRGEKSRSASQRHHLAAHSQPQSIDEEQPMAHTDEPSRTPVRPRGAGGRGDPRRGGLDRRHVRCLLSAAGGCRCRVRGRWPAGPAFDPGLPYRRSPSVAVRPEPFGALVYHFGTRRLSFLKTPQLVEVVQGLERHPDVHAAIEAAGRRGGAAPGLPAGPGRSGR